MAYDCVKRRIKVYNGEWRLVYWYNTFFMRAPVPIRAEGKTLRFRSETFHKLTCHILESLFYVRGTYLIM